LAVSAWRLAQGPIDLGWLSNRLRATFTDAASPVRMSFDGLYLAWEGFHKGVDYPIDLRLSNMTVTDPAGRRLAVAPQTHLTFSLAGLLLGRIVPRALEVDHAQIAVTRAPDGAINLGWDVAGSDAPASDVIDIRQFRNQLSRPVSSDHSRNQGFFDQLRHAHFRDTEVTLRDQESGLVVRTLGLDLDLIRTSSGRLHGSLQAPLSIGAQQADLTAQVDWVSGSSARLDLDLTSIRPASVQNLPRELEVMGHFDVPVSLSAGLKFDTGFIPSQITVQLQLGQGQIRLGQGTAALRSGMVALSGTTDKITIYKAHFDVAPTEAGHPETIDVGGTVVRAADRLTASLTVGLAQIEATDLPLLWPRGIGGGARNWIIEHVKGGTATHGTVSAVVESDEALRDVVVTRASGDLNVSNATFTWIDNMPSVDQAEAHIRLVDPDTLELHMTAGRQRIRNGVGDLVVKDGLMRITGLSMRDQIAVIRAQIDGPVVSAMALLKEPRLGLLSTHPVAVKPGGGDASAVLDLRLPLENNVRIDDVGIHADAHIKNLLLQDVAGGHDLTEGVFDLSVDKDGLNFKGQGSLAAVPVVLSGVMDFKSGPADQVVEKILVTGQPDALQLDEAGLVVTGIVTGRIPTTAALIGHRNGDGSITITGDLTSATLSVGPLAWRKPAGDVASASMTLLLSHGHLTKVDQIALRGDGLLLTGSANLIEGHIRSLLLDTIRMGRTQGRATVHFGTNEPVRVVFQSDQLDLSSKLTEKNPDADRARNSVHTTPDWRLDAHIDHVFLAHGVRADNVLVKASGGGDQIGLLDAIGAMRADQGRSNAGFSIRISPRGSERNLQLDAADAGAFLRGFDMVRTLLSGHLTINGVFSQPLGLSSLSGTLVIEDVVAKNSPLLGKLLQAITLYGMVDALSGPGMNFSHVVMPFRYDGINLDLHQAHADNPSLGLTAKGRIALSSDKTSVTGTIVPAYFFNSMLGQIPLVGKLFSPEKGGGVFAVRFGIEGSIDDPSISINPVSALTPGFFREIFGIFDRVPPKDNKPLNAQ